MSKNTIVSSFLMLLACVCAGSGTATGKVGIATYSPGATLVARTYAPMIAYSPGSGERKAVGAFPAHPLDANSQRACMNQCQAQGVQCNTSCNPGDLLCTNRCVTQQAQCYGGCK
jgi:hypothetical protein